MGQLAEAGPGEQLILVISGDVELACTLDGSRRGIHSHPRPGTGLSERPYAGAAREPGGRATQQESDHLPPGGGEDTLCQPEHFPAAVQHEPTEHRVTVLTSEGQDMAGIAWCDSAGRLHLDG